MSLNTMIWVPVADRDPGRLLAAVLQGVEAEVGELGHLLAGGPDTEDATGVLRSAVVGVEVVVQPAVTTWHCLMLSGYRTDTCQSDDEHPPERSHRPPGLTDWPDPGGSALLRQRLSLALRKELHA